MLLRITVPLVLLSTGCGRFGFATSEKSQDGGEAAIDSGLDGSSQPFDAQGSGIDAAAACATEILLGTASVSDDSGGFGAVITQISITFSPNTLFAPVGRGVGYINDYSGDTEFRVDNDGEFAAAMAPLMDGTATTANLGVLLFPSGGGALVPRPITPSVAGTTITMAKQRISSLSLLENAGTTDYVVSVVWELWGCL